VSSLKWGKTKHIFLQPYSVLEKATDVQTLYVTKFLLCSVDLNTDTIRGRTSIKTIFSFSPSTGKHFIGNELSSSDDSVTQVIHIYPRSPILRMRGQRNGYNSLSRKAWIRRENWGCAPWNSKNVLRHRMVWLFMLSQNTRSLWDSCPDASHLQIGVFGSSTPDETCVRHGCTI
jgi:hypothetical protein